MEWILLIWAVVATSLAINYYRKLAVLYLASTCLTAAGIVLAGGKKYAHSYFKVVANQDDGNVTRLLHSMRATYNLPQPRHPYDDLRLLEMTLVNDLTLREPAVLKEIRRYKDITE